MIVSVLVGDGDEVQSFEVDPSFRVVELVDIFGAGLDAEAGRVGIYHEGRLVEDKNATIEAIGVKEHDLLLLRVEEALRPEVSSTRSDALIERVRQQILTDPEMKARLSLTKPELVQAAESDPAQFQELFAQLHFGPMAAVPTEASSSSAAAAAAAAVNLMSADAQRRIEELIQAQNIAENLETAIEYHPESFGSVTMLYIPIAVNAHRLKAFVDCGAQTTIMTERCAERCELMRLLDRRFAGIAKGVGTSRILGRVHTVQMQMGSLFLPCSVTVIEGDGPDMLLGLDMLRRHQCCIDLQRGVLAVADQHIPFLPESEIPRED